MVLPRVEVFRAGVDDFVLRHRDPAGPAPADWDYRDAEGYRASTGE